MSTVMMICMSDDVATKKDIEDLIEVIRESMNVIATQTGEADNRIESKVDNLQITVNRIESKLDATVEQVDGHELRIGKLEHRPA